MLAVQYMAEFDPEGGCERNRQSGLHKGEVLRPVLVAATHSKTERQFPGNKRARPTIFYPPWLFFASIHNNLSDCGETEGKRRPPHSQLSCNKMNDGNMV